MSGKEEMDLQRLFNPRSIAIIGASDDLTRIGGLPIRFLRQHGYPGKIFPVNPKYREIVGLPCFPNLTSIPDEVDLTLIGLPRSLVPDALQQCAGKKVPFVILFSAGYAEMGPVGRKEQEELRRFVRQAGIRVVGPNCLGIINTFSQTASSFTSGLELDFMISGSIGLISQSGGIGNCFFTRAYDHGIGLGYFISSGNELDLEAADFLEYFSRDERIRSIALSLEDIKDIPKFSRAADQARQAGKPIVTLKVGRSEKGRQAAASHTGAMSGADGLYDALFKQRRILRVFDIDTLLGTANLFACYDPPGGDRIGLLTSSGGSGALMADLADDYGLKLPAPSPKTREQLHDLIPQVASLANPMDITTQFMGDPEALARYLQVFAQDENFDLLILALTISSPTRTLPLAERIAAVAPSLPKPLVVCWPVGNMALPSFQCLEKGKIPVFSQPSGCLEAVARFVKVGLWKMEERGLRS